MGTSTSTFVNLRKRIYNIFWSLTLGKLGLEHLESNNVDDDHPNWTEMIKIMFTILHGIDPSFSTCREALVHS